MTAPETAAALLTMRGVEKSFGGAQALHRIHQVGRLREKRPVPVSEREGGIRARPDLAGRHDLLGHVRVSPGAPIGRIDAVVEGRGGALQHGRQSRLNPYSCQRRSTRSQSSGSGLTMGG